MNDRIRATVDMLALAAREMNMTVTGDQRVSSADAAKLLQSSEAYLKQLRNEGKGPLFYKIGMGGCRYSYRIEDLGIWIESGRENIFA